MKNSHIGERLRTLLFFALVISSGWSCSCVGGASDDTYQYGGRIKYLDNQTKKLPDFSIRFLGSISDSSPECPTDCTEYDFEIIRGPEQRDISWSRKINDLEPKYFEIGGKNYVLELGNTLVDSPEEEMSWDKLIIWEKNDYEKKRSKKKQ